LGEKRSEELGSRRTAISRSQHSAVELLCCRGNYLFLINFSLWENCLNFLSKNLRPKIQNCNFEQALCRKISSCLLEKCNLLPPPTFSTHDAAGSRRLNMSCASRQSVRSLHLSVSLSVCLSVSVSVCLLIWSRCRV